ncbi:ETC complex I subunit [Picrophilus oshimae]|nr:hypothetical protein [Picrophilus oshimae]SMD30833.1 hypothetical protein SAMN02745355_0747 [Picrophilus oshimae DSM 9789]
MNRLISFKIVDSKTEAINYMLEHGIEYTMNVIEKKERSRELLERYLHEGLPELPSDLSDISIMERE